MFTMKTMLRHDTAGDPRSTRSIIRTGRRRRAIVAAIATASVLALSACGGAGGGGGDASGEAPIKLGILNPVNGAATAPGASQGLNAAVTYVNEELGGIDGHPLEVVSCDVDISSPETNLGCANELATSGAVAVIDAYNATSSAAVPIFESAGIPVIGPVPFDAATGAVTEGRVYFAPAPAAFLLGAMQSIKDQGYTSLTLANLDIPSGHQTIDQVLIPLGQTVGVDIEGVYYSPTNPNFTVLASTIASTGAEVAGLLVAQDEQTCDRLAEALQSVGYEGVIFLATCTQFIDHLGAEAEGAQIYSSIWLPQARDSAPDDIKENLDIAEQYVTALDGPSDWNAYALFGTVVDFARTLTAAGLDEYTGATVLDALKAVKDYQSFLGPVLSCDRPTSPNCTTEFYNFEVVGDQKLEAVGGGTVQPDEEILKAIPGAS